MPRHAFKNTDSLADRATARAKDLREKAQAMIGTPEREDLLRRADQLDNVGSMVGYLRSNDLKPPN